MIRKDGKEYVLSAGVVVVRHASGRWRLLLLRAWGFWDFPKGIVEEGETPVEAAIREVEEESGINDLNFRWGHDYMDTGPYNNGRKIARYYLAETSTDKVVLRVNPEIGRPEHDAFRWADFSETRSLVAERVKPVLDWAAKTCMSENLQ